MIADTVVVVVRERVRNPVTNMTLHQGNSLIEVVVAAAIVALILVGLVNVTTTNLSNSQYSRNKTLATKYADEALEWIRIQRDALGWDALSYFASASPPDYCMNTLVWTYGGLCDNTDARIDELFHRDVNLYLDPLETGKITVTVKVSWVQGALNPNVTVKSIVTSH